MFSLHKKTALVTGSASGIGAAIAETFAQAGATVWIADLDEANGRAVAKRIGGQFVLLDVSSETDSAWAAQTGREAGNPRERSRHRSRGLLG